MTLIRLTIIPEAKKNVVKLLKDGRYEVRLKAKPEHNQANELLLQVLAVYFHLPTTSIKIVAGHHSHHKRVEIVGYSISEVE